MKLYAKRTEVVLKEAYNRGKLLNLLGNECGHEAKGRPCEQSIKEEEEGIVVFLKSKGLWESVLYQTEAGKDLFLLNQGTLNFFLKEYYEAYVRYL